MKGNDSLPKDTLVNYILANEKIAKNKEEISDLYEEVINQKGQYNYLDQDSVSLASGDRLDKCLLQVLEKSGYILLQEDRIKLNFAEYDEVQKRRLFDIVMYKDYFIENEIVNDSNSRKAYIQYMQSPNLKIKSSKLRNFNEAKTINKGKNIIFFGAPETGKSYNIAKFIQRNGIEKYNETDGHPNVFRTTLHPEFSYNDFVGQVMPVVKPDKSITYDFSSNIFTNSLSRAMEVPGEPVFLILEEINRSNVSSVFGDIFQLLDRNTIGESEYRIDNELISNNVFGMKNRKIYLPSNFFLLGTVNTSDQNVFVMDAAFKRRFEFEYVDVSKMQKDKVTGEYINDFILEFNDNKANIIKISWIELLKKINGFIINDLELSEDKQLGQFFVKFDGDYTENFKKIQSKVLEYLWSDVQCASFSDISLFDEKIKGFGQIYVSTKENYIPFSSAFFEKLRNE